jgi:hypothetical protein
MPILGIVASSYPPAGGYDLIQTANVTTATGNLYFTNIPQTYSHLQLRVSMRTTNASINYSSLYIAPNDNLTTSYTVHQFYTDGAAGPSAAGRAAGSDNSFMVQNFAGGTAPTYTFGSGIVDIYNYRNTNHYKVMRSFAGTETTTPGNGWVFWNSSIFTANTNAITSLTLYADGNFAPSTLISLYGSK